jgi:surfeit locus 1 family protein
MVILIPLFCGLGIWQLERAEQKRQLTVSQEARRKLPPRSLNQDVPESSKLAFRSVTAKGHYMADKTVLIENRKHRGQSGFHVITPLQLEGSKHIVLVNRGWVSRKQLTNGQLPDTPIGLQLVSGDITIPEPPALELALETSKDQQTPHWPYLTVEQYAQWSGMEILPFAILQSPDDQSGFVRKWPRPQFSDTMHIGYAIQWFAFALITLLIWLRLSLPKQQTEGNQS